MTGEPAPRLAPPGVPVPFWQRWAGRFVLLPSWRRRLTWERIPDVVDRQGRDLLAGASGVDDEELERRVLVAPMIGLEDSSRHASWAMVLEHLTTVGGATARIVVDLTHGRRPAGEVRTAALKAAGDVPVQTAIREYREMLATFRRSLERDVGNRDSRTRHAHPWFGPLDAYSWACFAPFHQAIHLRQAEKILEGLRTRGR